MTNENLLKKELEKLNKEFGLTTNEDGTVTTNSLKVAEYYGKGHNDVMKKIRKFIELIPELGQGNFTQSSYINEQNKEQPMYIMDRQGFSMLVNKFTGDEATIFTYKYTKAFERMVEIITLLQQENKELTDDLVEVSEIAMSDKEQAKREYETKKKLYGYKRIKNVLENCTYKNIEDTVNDIIDFHVNKLKKKDRAFNYSELDKTSYKQVIRDRIDAILENIYNTTLDGTLRTVAKELQYINQKDKIKTINRSNSHKECATCNN